MNYIQLGAKSFIKRLDNLIFNNEIIILPYYIKTYPKFISKWDTVNKVVKFGDDREDALTIYKNIVYTGSDGIFNDTLWLITPGRKRKYLMIFHLDLDSKRNVSGCFRKSFAVIINRKKLKIIKVLKVTQYDENSYFLNKLNMSDLPILLVGEITKALNETEDLNPILKNKLIGELMRR